MQDVEDEQEFNQELDPKTRGCQENLSDFRVVWKKWRQGGLFLIYCQKCVTVEDSRVSTTSENTVSATITAHRLRGGACEKQTVAQDKLFLMLLCNVLHFARRKLRHPSRIRLCSRCVLDYWMDVTQPR